MDNIIEITKEQFTNFTSFASGMYQLINTEETPSKFLDVTPHHQEFNSSGDYRFFIATFNSNPEQTADVRLIVNGKGHRCIAPCYTDRLFIIKPTVIEAEQIGAINPVLVRCLWWIFDCSRDTTDWPGVPTEATHVSRGKWVGVKWFTMDYVTGYDGEDFVEEMTRDMQLLREVLKLCGANDWEQ